MSNGKTVQIIGAVVDAEFPREAIPGIYDALIIEEADVTLEVQQQLGDGIVRCIAMGSSEGLKRGMDVRNTGAPISIPVGTGTLGRIIEGRGPRGRGAMSSSKPGFTPPIRRPVRAPRRAATRIRLLGLM